MSESKPIPLTQDNLLRFVQKSVGSDLWARMDAIYEGKRQDILKNGQLSCAYYASSVLVIHKLIARVHATVMSTLVDLKTSGWVEIASDSATPGDVLVWGPEPERGNEHWHIGFFVGNEAAVSTSSTEGVVARHHWTYTGQRPIVSAWQMPEI